MIFLSYSHAQSDYADKIEQYLNRRHVAVMRDSHDERETDSISGFIRRVGEADMVILLISPEYMKSYYCLYEALLAYSHRDKRNLIPILLPEANILTWEGQFAYHQFWQEAKEKLGTMVRTAAGPGTVEWQKALRQIEAYCNYLGDFMGYLKDTVCIQAEEGEEALEKLYKCICGKILDREVRYRTASPNQTRGIQLPESRYLAIDFGTSYTLMATLDEAGNTLMIPDREGRTLHRSTIAFAENGDYQVGTDSPQAVRHIKRKIGIRDTVDVNGEPWSVTLLVAMILKAMVRNAEEYLNASDFQVILSMPTDFSLRQKGILLESARIAGINVKRAVQESAVASLLPSKKVRQIAAFIDLGGGTLDISLADVYEGVMDILYSDGDSSFGSLDFDEDMVRMLEKKLLEEHGVRGQNLDVLAEQVKCRLSQQEQVGVTYLESDEFGDMRMLPLTVTRQEFEAAAQARLEQFRHKLHNLAEFMGENGYWTPVYPITVYLTGQGTKLYALKKMIEAEFPRIPIVDRFQESAVIRGLSRLIQSFSDPDLLLINAMPCSIYCRASGYNQEEDFYRISPGENPELICLAEGETIPTYRWQELDFVFPKGANQPMEFPLTILEKTASGRECILVDTTVTAKPKKSYKLILDVDADYRVRIRFGELDSEDAIQTFQF